MAVLPDAIFHITPTVDVQVAFGEGEGFHDHGGQGGDVLPGCFVGAEKVSSCGTEYKQTLTWDEWHRPWANQASRSPLSMQKSVSTPWP